MQTDLMAPASPRAVADWYVGRLAALNPIIATTLGLGEGCDALPDLSPDGIDAEAALRREALGRLASVWDPARGATPHGDSLPPAERRCARLLAERLAASLALYDGGEDLRSLRTLGSPLHAVRQVFLLMPMATAEDWEVVRRRMDAVAGALASYRTALDAGRAQGLLVGPAQVDTVLAQLGDWLGETGGEAFFAGLASRGPRAAGPALDAAARRADGAVADFRDWLARAYAPAAHEWGRDAVGPDRYARAARYWTGSDLDLAQAYEWAWAEFADLAEQLRDEALRVRPGATVREAMAWLDAEGPAIDGVPQVREYLQGLMDSAIRDLSGTHFDIAEELTAVEAMIAPPGSAAAPYYTRPGVGFTRPGRTWLPTMGRTRFPLWQLVSTWYHEGVPGHHLQLGQWVLMAPQLSVYQTTIGSVGATVEGWALYAERLMDELGHLPDAGARLGYLDAQQMRTVRVIIDIGMHLELPIPADQGVSDPFRPGERWTPQAAREFLGRNCGRPAQFLDSEIARYLGMPGQAISYKLGERAWLAGRQRARAARAGQFDARGWHMAALSLGSLGLDDLVEELAAL